MKYECTICSQNTSRFSQELAQVLKFDTKKGICSHICRYTQKVETDAQSSIEQLKRFEKLFVFVFELFIGVNLGENPYHILFYFSEV